MLVVLESGIGPFDFQESLELMTIDKKHIRFSALRGKEIMGGFENAGEFIELCTKYSNEALKTMDMQTKMKLYELYNDKQLLFRMQYYRVKRIFELNFEDLKKTFNKGENIKITKWIKDSVWSKSFKIR